MKNAKNLSKMHRKVVLNLKFDQKNKILYKPADGGLAVYDCVVIVVGLEEGNRFADVLLEEKV